MRVASAPRSWGLVPDFWMVTCSRARTGAARMRTTSVLQPFRHALRQGRAMRSCVIMTLLPPLKRFLANPHGMRLGALGGRVTERALSRQLAAGQRQRFVNGLGNAARLDVGLLAPGIPFSSRLGLRCAFHFLSRTRCRADEPAAAPQAPE